MSSILKVDTIQDQDGNNIINENANVITIGASGDTITVPAGATLSGDLNADNLTSGTVPDARITGAYTGITNLTMSGDLSIQNSSGSATAALKTTASDTPVTFTLDGNRTSNGGIGSIVFSNNGDSVGMIRSNRASANDAADMVFYTQATGGANSERMRITSAGEVAIGTTSVGNGELLKVAGKVYINAAESDSIFTTGACLIFPGTYNNIRQSTNHDLQFDSYNGGDIKTPLTIKQDGKIGIGTSSPVTPLNVIGGSDLGIEVSDTSSGGNGVITIKGNATNGGSYLQFGDTDDDNVGRVYYTHDDNAMKFNTADAERMRIASTGHIGMGTTTTTYALNIANGAGNMRIKTTDSANVANASTSILEFHGSNNRAGYVGFVGGDMNIHTDTYSSPEGNIKLSTNGSERMRINSDGSTLVGSTSNGTESNLNVHGQFGLSAGRGFVFEKQDGTNGSGFTSVTLQFTTGANGRTCFIETMVGSSGYYLYHVSHRYSGGTVNVLVNQGNGPTISWSVSNSGSNSGSVYTYVVNFPSGTSSPYAKFKVSLGGYITTPITSTSLTFA